MAFQLSDIEPPAKPATDAQIRFAKKIHDLTGAALPAERTRQSLFLYIRDNLLKYDYEMRMNNRGKGGLFDPRDGDWPDNAVDAFDEAVYWGLDPYTGGFDD